MRTHAVLLTVSLLAFAGCSHPAVSALPDAPVPGAARQGAAPAAVVWTQSDGYKVLMTDPPQPKNRTARVSGARGETVSFQVIVSAKSALSGVDAAMSDLRDAHGHAIRAGSNVQLFREFYVDLTQKSDRAGHLGWFPDGLVPIGLDPYFHERRNGTPFDVAAGNNQGIWVDVTIPASAAAGTYRATVTLSAGKTALASVPVTLTVWNFTLPATPTLTTAFGLDTWQTYQGHYGPNWVTSKIVALTNLYDTEALKHRISLYDNAVANPQYAYDKKTNTLTYISYSLFDSTMAPYLGGTLNGASGARGTNAQFPTGNPNLPGPTPGPNDAEYVTYWKNVSAHFKARGYYDRAFFYDIDEPSSDLDYQTAAHRADVLHEADPGVPAMVTTKLDARLIGHIQIWTTIVNEFGTPGNPPPSAYAARQKLGEKVWLYHSDSSVADGQWPDFFVDHGTSNARIFSWLDWRYALDGFLYYATTQTYTEYPNPWTDVYSFGDNGDGVLFYPGRVSLIGGKHDIPCASIRLKSIRAAMQDYEYMALLKAKGQGAFVDALVKSIAPATNRWNHDPAALEAARKTMGARLSRS